MTLEQGNNQAPKNPDEMREGLIDTMKKQLGALKQSLTGQKPADLDKHTQTTVTVPESTQPNTAKTEAFKPETMAQFQKLNATLEQLIGKFGTEDATQKLRAAFLGNSGDIVEGILDREKQTEKLADLAATVEDEELALTEYAKLTKVPTFWDGIKNMFSPLKKLGITAASFIGGLLASMPFLDGWSTAKALEEAEENLNTSEAFNDLDAEEQALHDRYFKIKEKSFIKKVQRQYSQDYRNHFLLAHHSKAKEKPEPVLPDLMQIMARVKAKEDAKAAEASAQQQNQQSSERNQAEQNN